MSKLLAEDPWRSDLPLCCGVCGQEAQRSVAGGCPLCSKIKGVDVPSKANLPFVQELSLSLDTPIPRSSNIGLSPTTTAHTQASRQGFAMNVWKSWIRYI